MNIDINQYDLNELFRFDLLKNILLNITEEQKKINEELNQLKLSNKIRDDKIKNLEKINTFRSLGFEDELINLIMRNQPKIIFEIIMKTKKMLN